MKRTLAMFGMILLTTSAAQADSLVTARPVGDDTVLWSQLGAAGDGIANPFQFSTANGVAGMGSYALSGTGQVVVQVQNQNPPWLGNFTVGDYANWNEGNGAITLNFAQGYSQIGAQIDPDVYGPFTAQICDVNGCFTENGNGTPDADGSAIYIGISSGTPINWVSFDILSDGELDDFAINQVTLNGASTAPSVTPEPSSFVLLGTGLAGMLGAARRRR